MLKIFALLKTENSPTGSWTNNYDEVPAGGTLCIHTHSFLQRLL